MEYTKDMILGVRYGEVHNTLKDEKQKRTSRFWHAMGRHKIATAIIVSAIVFICIDVVLVTNFFRILILL